MSATLEDEFGEIVEEIVAVGAREDAVRFDEEGLDAGVRSGLGGVFEVVRGEGASVGGAVGIGELFRSGAEFRLNYFPCAFAEVGCREGGRVSFYSVFVEEGVVADIAERRMVLGEGGQDEGHAGRAGVLFEDGAVDGAKEALLVVIGVVGFGAVAVTHAGSECGAAIGGDSLVGLGVFVAKGVGDGGGDAVGEGDFVELISVAFEEADLTAIEGEDLVAIGGLLDAEKGFQVERGGGGRQFGDGALQLESMEASRGPENGQTIPRVVPEVCIGAEGVEWGEEFLSVGIGEARLESGLELLDEILVADGILLILGVPSVSRQVDGEAGRVVGLEECFQLVGAN